MQVQKALLSCKENRQDGGDRMSINSIAKEKKRNDWVCLAEMLWSVGFPSKILHYCLYLRPMALRVNSHPVAGLVCMSYS